MDPKDLSRTVVATSIAVFVTWWMLRKSKKEKQNMPVEMSAFQQQALANKHLAKKRAENAAAKRLKDRLKANWGRIQVTALKDGS